jgi:hypothetical protein
VPPCGARRAWLLPVVALLLAVGSEAWARSRLDVTKIFFEYNASANDLGVHVFLDGEDRKAMRIVNPGGATILEVEGKGPYANLGLTELSSGNQSITEASFTKP